MGRGVVFLLREGAILGGEFGCIHRALLALYPAYKLADGKRVTEPADR